MLYWRKRGERMKNGKYCILIADDEKEIRDILRLLLEGEGYAVLTAEDGREAIAEAAAEVDLYILDVNMPEVSGFPAAAEIRKHFDAPIVFLTAYSTESDKVMGFSVGADDYIVKPFEIEELLARVEAVLRRTGRGGQTLTAFDVTMDIVARTVTRQGKAVELTPREFDLLEQLMRNRGAALYRDVLYGRVWGGDLLDSRTLDLHIQRLRKKLGWADKIETVYRVGYRLKSDQK